MVLLLQTHDNFNISLYGTPMQEVTISFSWGDTRMSASMESILGGYDDPRAGKYWDPAADATLPAATLLFLIKELEMVLY